MRLTTHSTTEHLNATSTGEFTVISVSLKNERNSFHTLKFSVPHLTPDFFEIRTETDVCAGNNHLHERTAKFLLNGCLNGFNGTVFAYGATGSGKTYTMTGTKGVDAYLPNG